jgi:hypothetical protein
MVAVNIAPGIFQNGQGLVMQNQHADLGEYLQSGLVDLVFGFF